MLSGSRPAHSTQRAAQRARSSFIARMTRSVLLASGVASIAAAIWLLAGFPLLVDKWLDVTSAPVPADAIVCIAGGTASHDIPTSEGWQRIHTSVALYADRYAPVVVFTGRGNAKVSQAEIYAGAAAWMGLEREVVRLDPLPASTAEHPDTLLKSLGSSITRDSRLLLVTSTLHSRRVLMTFRSRGFHNIRVVSDYTPKARLPGSKRAESSTLPAFTRDTKRYDDPMIRLTYRSAALFTALREWAALAAYKWRGDI